MIAPDGWRPMTAVERDGLPGNIHTRFTLNILLGPVEWMAELGERDAAFTLETLALAEYRSLLLGEDCTALRPGESWKDYGRRLCGPQSV